MSHGQNQLNQWSASHSEISLFTSLCVIMLTDFTMMLHLLSESDTGFEYMCMCHMGFEQMFFFLMASYWLPQPITKIHNQPTPKDCIAMYWVYTKAEVWTYSTSCLWSIKKCFLPCGQSLVYLFSSVPQSAIDFQKLSKNTPVRHTHAPAHIFLHQHEHKHCSVSD